MKDSWFRLKAIELTSGRSVHLNFGISCVGSRSYLSSYCGSVGNKGKYYTGIIQGCPPLFLTKNQDPETHKKREASFVPHWGDCHPEALALNLMEASSLKIISVLPDARTFLGSRRVRGFKTSPIGPSGGNHVFSLGHGFPSGTTKDFFFLSFLAYWASQEKKAQNLWERDKG